MIRIENSTKHDFLKLWGHSVLYSHRLCFHTLRRFHFHVNIVCQPEPGFLRESDPFGDASEFLEIFVFFLSMKSEFGNLLLSNGKPLYLIWMVFSYPCRIALKMVYNELSSSLNSLIEQWKWDFPCLLPQINDFSTNIPIYHHVAVD